MTRKESLLYNLHNLGNCKGGYFNGVIRSILTVNSKTSDVELITLEKEINALVFEYGVNFGDEYPNSAKDFIKELKSNV